MTAFIVAVGPGGRAIADDLRHEGARVVAVCSAEDIDDALLSEADAVLLPATRRALTRPLVSACDRARVRIIPVGGDEPRLLRQFGLPDPLPAAAPGRHVLDALSGRTSGQVETPPRPKPRIIAVWGPHGAPGRSTLAIDLAAALAARGRHTALIDADTHAPALALLLGLSEDAPGVAAACRRAVAGGVDAPELTRLSVAVPVLGGSVDVLGGLNRPSRWPELSADRLRAVLAACRGWADDTIVDVAAALESDEEIISDVDGPRRNAATTATLAEADAIVAVASADHLGIARFLHAHAELRALVGTAPVTVVVNRSRTGPLGIDARGQVRHTLERFAGIRDVHFLPEDRRAADAALLHGRPITDVAARSALSAAIRRVAEVIPGSDAAASDLPRPRRARRGR